MMQKPQQSNIDPRKTAPAKPARPNESGRLEIMDHIRIFDPNTKKVMVEKRS